MFSKPGKNGLFPGERALSGPFADDANFPRAESGGNVPVVRGADDAHFSFVQRTHNIQYGFFARFVNIGSRFIEKKHGRGKNEPRGEGNALPI